LLLADLPHIIVATPGRLADLIGSTDLRLNKTQFLVLDEADRLLDRDDGDFHDDLQVIIEKLPKERQTLMFSATLSETIAEARQQGGIPLLSII
jgi:ATP-dependent RNA helicase DDX49/DBP8